MSEIERINILDFLLDSNSLTQSGHQEYDGNKLIFQNLFFPLSISTEINQGNKIVIGNKDVSLRGFLNFVFINCEFEGALNVNILHFNFELRNCILNELNINNIQGDSHNLRYMKFITSTIRNIAIKNCSFTDRFYINPQDRDEPTHINRIENLLIQDTIFGHNFKLHNCEVQHCDINNTDFEKNAGFFKSNFLQTDELLFKSLNFRGLALFGECVFTSTFNLEYVTFSGMCHFRKSMFKKGLNLDNANIEKEMNFYDAKELDSEESKKITSQETYRIIKFNFSKIGNQIEANKFHKLELEKRANYLQQHKKDYFAEWIVFFAHKITSNMGRSWFRPLVGIVIIGMLTNGYLNYKFSLDGHLSWQSIKHYIDHTFEFMSIISEKKQFSSDDKTIYWLMFLNKVMLGYLYYQFVTAVRKDTTQK